MPTLSDFVLGVDLGQAQDFTAIAVVEVDSPQLGLRHLERLPLGTPYPSAVERVSGLARALPGRSALVVDAGGPGRPVVDAMRAAGLKPIPVSITSGKRERYKNGMVYLPKRELVRGMVSSIEVGRLKIAKGLPLADALAGELQAFRVRLTARGRDTYAAKPGAHDDLVIATALAVWWGCRAPATAGPIASGLEGMSPRNPWERPTAASRLNSIPGTQVPSRALSALS